MAESILRLICIYYNIYIYIVIWLCKCICAQIVTQPMAISGRKKVAGFPWFGAPLLFGAPASEGARKLPMILLLGSGSPAPTLVGVWVTNHSLNAGLRRPGRFLTRAT